MINISEVHTKEDWEKIKSEALNKNEIIVFKFSPICTVSFTAGKILDLWLSKLSLDNNLDVIKINVIESRELSNIIATETDIKHESPQLIWFDDNRKIKWSYSHFRISEVQLNMIIKN